LRGFRREVSVLAAEVEDGGGVGVISEWVRKRVIRKAM